MLKVRFRTVRTPFRQPFTTSYETKTHQESLMIAIEYNGLRGIGEAPAISYYNISTQQMIELLQAKAQMIEQYAFTEPQRFWHFCHHLFPENDFLVCALDLAYWDLYSQVKKQTIAEIVSGHKAAAVPTFYTLGQADEATMLQKMNDQPWPQYKVKVTSKPSVEVLSKLKAQSASDFAVDANAAWTLAEAYEYIPMLVDLGVLFIEQPLAKGNFEDMQLLKGKYSVPFFADESFQKEKDLPQCQQAFDGINIKLTKCSGLSPAILIIEKAKTLNMKTMLGCMNETEVGIYLAAQIGHLVDYCDLDGALLLDTPLKKLGYQAGQIIFND